MRLLAVISPHHPYPPPSPNHRRALSLASTPGRSCAASWTAQRPIRNIRRESEWLRTHSGVRRKGPQCPPRLHDLRHAAAVHRLTAWYREGKDVQRLLPLLSTYLGHVDIASTQLYLTMTPELLYEASQRFAQYVFGEVSHG